MRYLATKKDVRKLTRSIIQAILLLLLFWILVNLIFNFKKYTPYVTEQTAEDRGFIAISYIAVDRDGTATMIGKRRLDEHLGALKLNGYVTITQEDMKAYYMEGKSLPERPMFLMFEDGRVDTGIFASNLLEKYNYIGTMLSYGDRLDDKDLKFLKAKNLKKLEDSTFWELGTNGYRLSYINVYDRYDNFLGELTYYEYSQLSKYFGRNYNHYLMDFIRDEDKIPKENYDEMKNRIDQDYRLMEQSYEKYLGKLPDMYVLMHSNTGAFGTNERVSRINEEWIKNLFSMNFNREGYSHNNRDVDLYDLTRMQPQPYWYPNHLLMRIWDDTGDDMEFVYGDLKKKEEWDILNGAPEFRESIIALTSEPKGKGLIRLKDSDEYRDYKLSTVLTGNMKGSQAVYLRSDEDLNKYVKVNIENNCLYIEENGSIIYELDLDVHDEIIPSSVEEDEFHIQMETHKVYEKGISPRTRYKTRMEPQQMEEYVPATVEEGAEEYKPDMDISQPGKRKLDIYLEGSVITVVIDDKLAAENIKLTGDSSGYIYLESGWSDMGYSQRNIADDVYDGVFEDLLITDLSDEEIVLYKNKLEGMALLKSKIASKWNQVINWFIINM